MPQVQLDQGDTARLFTSESRFQTVQLTPKGGAVKKAKTEQTARSGTLIPEGTHNYTTFFYSGEDLWVEAQSDGVTVEYVKQGFLDFNFQNIESNTTRVSAQGVVETNGDQTATVSGGGSQSTIVKADKDEVWRLEGFYFEYTAESVDFTVTVQSEAQAIEWGFATVDGPSTRPHFYRSGDWETEPSGNWDTKRDQIREHKIDDTNGLEVKFSNDGTSDITNTRKLRFEFDVVKA